MRQLRRLIPPALVMAAAALLALVGIASANGIPSPPHITKPSLLGGALSGVGSGKPHLFFSVGAGADVPLLRALSVTVPKGLSFTGKVGRAITIDGTTGKLGFTAKRSGGGKLTITLKTAQPNGADVKVVITHPAFSVNPALQQSVHDGQTIDLTVVIDAIDVDHESTQLKLTSGP